MIEFFSENDFQLTHQKELTTWIGDTLQCEGMELGELTFVFSDDAYLHSINVEFLAHDTYTDIITFDYNLGKQVHGEIYISTERVAENAKQFQVSFKEELFRVLIHGVLHLCGYKDKSLEETQLMREKENFYLKKIAYLSA
ncbi:MAG: rRNA maturation RNase YbeY [Alteromonas sp.]|nr:rRNA maturation RNase YbeY [Alteromonas sp.]MAY23790.1 rRNA maturation RNase YbeY [Flavobacteriaceae bacterium]|tara:strand:- start:1081 stop:1503 length:423 start_codon:yes stop_codon:yes gene_type:complete